MRERSRLQNNWQTIHMAVNEELNTMEVDHDHSDDKDHEAQPEGEQTWETLTEPTPDQPSEAEMNGEGSQISDPIHSAWNR